MANENLGAAERIVAALLAYSDHLYHNRPGVVRPDGRTNVGVRWEYVTHKVEDGVKVVYSLSKAGKKTVKTKLGIMRDDFSVVDAAGTKIGEYRSPGLFPEVAAWMYSQIAEVWKLDNEFAARWASYSYGRDSKDLKVVLAAFMLVQSRKGDPVRDGGKIAFHDEDFRDVGEAMILLRRKDGKDLNPKMLLRVRELLSCAAVAEINRSLGFGNSARKPFLGRWPAAVEKWLRHREENPRVLEGLVKGGMTNMVKDLSRAVSYKPDSPRFFEILRWKQAQAKDGRRGVAIGAPVAAAESWDDMSEADICSAIERSRPGWKRIVGLVPKRVGLTRAIVAAAVTSGSLSDKDLVILSPTLEDLGLLEVQDVRERWSEATRKADDMRAANVAARMRGRAAKEELETAADVALQKSVEEVVKGMRIYVLVDISGSMANAITAAKTYLSKFLQGFPLDQLHVAIFNTMGREVVIKHQSAAGVTAAFTGVVAGGGTSYREGVKAFKVKPKDDEDSLLIVIGDQQDQDANGMLFAGGIRTSGIRPMAIGFIEVVGTDGMHRQTVVGGATALGVPLIRIDQTTFSDPYAIPRTIRNLVAATPIGATMAPAVRRKTLADEILETQLLAKPAWA